MAEYAVDTVALILRLEKRKMGARIAATAAFLAVPLVTDDAKIGESAFVRTVW